VRSCDPSGVDRLIIAPRWGGGPDDDFYPWLMAQLRLRVPGISVEALATPEGAWPRPEAWAARVDAALGALSPAELARTALLGHSVGSHALLHGLTRLPPGHEVGALVIVGGWWDISRASWAGFGIPWARIQAWLDLTLDDDAVRAHVSKVRVLLSDDDPVPDSSAQVAEAAFRRRLGAEVRRVSDRQHFNAKREPAVLDAVAGLFEVLPQ
jgi:predicted alpha/beta hydrolase family esterase